VPTVQLKDIPSNPSQAEVDDLVLLKGGDRVELTDDQLTRLKSTSVKLDTGEASEPDPDNNDTNPPASARR